MTTEQAERGTRYHHGDLKTALVEATLELISEKRVEDVSVADAARAAGVSSGAPYRHFTDREDLLAHVAAKGFERLREATQGATSQHPPGSIEGIIAGGCAYTEFGASRPELFHLMWGAARSTASSEIARELSLSCYSAFIETLTLTMEREGLGHLDPHEFGAPLWAMVHGFAGLLISKPAPLDANIAATRSKIAAATHAYFDGVKHREGVLAGASRAGCAPG